MCSSLKSTEQDQIFVLLFQPCSSRVLILTKNELGFILGNIFKNLSGHPVPDPLFRFQSGREKQGCQMVYLQTKNPIWNALDWKMLIYFMAIWNILQTFVILCDHLVHFVFIWYILCQLGTFCVH
jgi:hypothetical protein